MYVPICPIPGSEAFRAFRIQTAEEARQGLLDSWATVDQQIYNLSTEQCRQCKGRGYAVYRSKGVLVRESVGCGQCGGLGKVPRVQREDTAE